MALEFSGMPAGDDVLVFGALPLVAVAGDEELLVARLGIAGDEGLEGGEQLDEAGEQRLLGELLEALVEEQGVGEVAGRLGVGGGEEVGNEVGIVAEGLGQRDAAGAGGLEGLVVDGEEDGAEEARGDELVQELGELLRVAVLDDPEQDGRAEVLLGLPAVERGGELVGLAVLHEEVDALGGELALGGLEEGEDDLAPLEGMGVLDEVEEARLEVDGDLRRRWRAGRGPP
jgi:hypothetical protein